MDWANDVYSKEESILMESGFIFFLVAGMI